MMCLGPIIDLRPGPRSSFSSFVGFDFFILEGGCPNRGAGGGGGGGGGGRSLPSMTKSDLIVTNIVISVNSPNISSQLVTKSAFQSIVKCHSDLPAPALLLADSLALSVSMYICGGHSHVVYYVLTSFVKGT